VCGLTVRFAERTVGEMKSSETARKPVIKSVNNGKQ
jgi:hypothetical protein